MDGLAASMGKPDWNYRDLPNMTVKLMDKFIAAAGEENLHWITFAERKWPDGNVTVRGQLLISPQGIENLKEIVNAEQP